MIRLMLFFFTYLQFQIKGQTISHNPQTSSSTGSSYFTTSFSGMFSSIPFFTTCVQSDSHWLIDTGASYHVYCSASEFKSLTTVVNAFLTLPNSQKVLISSIGTIQLTPSLILHFVLYVPSFSYNLLSFMLAV